MNTVHPVAKYIQDKDLITLAIQLTRHMADSTFYQIIHLIKQNNESEQKNEKLSDLIKIFCSLVGYKNTMPSYTHAESGYYHCLERGDKQTRCSIKSMATREVVAEAYIDNADIDAFVPLNSYLLKFWKEEWHKEANSSGVMTFTLEEKD